MKIVVAMSGGVDSSVAAALLIEQGHEVTGITMQLMPARESTGANAVEGAKKAVEKLGIPHSVIDLSKTFHHSIIEDFCREYSLGRTPNPCVRCNAIIKFGALWEKAAETGADFIATGHYARIEKSGNNMLLKKGIDKNKDQSYFLCRLTCEQLSRTLFPVGELTKEDVRRKAKEAGLPAADRAESQEICFIPDNDYSRFLSEYLKQPPRRGPILNEEGKVLGKHKGITAYTIGQRHGLGIANAEPLYVTAIEPEHNAVIVGTKNQTYSTELIAGDINWITPPTTNGTFTIKAKIRYRHPEAEATVTPLDDGYYHINFFEPQMSITPGQTIAFYDGDTVLGGGTIIKQGRQI